MDGITVTTAAEFSDEALDALADLLLDHLEREQAADPLPVVPIRAAKPRRPASRRPAMDPAPGRGLHTRTARCRRAGSMNTTDEVK